jgi:hypothetical protein
MVPIAVPDPRRPDWHAHDSGFKEIFGLDPKAKWPDTGLTNRFVATSDDHVTRLWVEPITATSRQGVPRLMAQCAKCHASMGAGRIQQHYKSCKK